MLLSSFLLEIGTEELPADFARLALPQLEGLVLNDFARLRLSHGACFCGTSPRRISLLVENMADSAEDLEELRKGPSAEQAFKDAKPTRAAIGFAKSLGLVAEDLEIKDTDKGAFVFAKVTQLGANTKDILQTQIPLWISGIQGRRFMRWGEGERRFSRPIRWIVAMLDEEIIPVTLTDTDPVISSGNTSRGNRLYSNHVKINSAKSYIEELRKSGVVVDRKERGEMINNMINSTSKTLNAWPDLPSELSEELTDLVEQPMLVQGSIDNKYLDLPPEVISTVMKVHQRYVPLYKNDASFDDLLLNSRATLLPKFLCITNSLSSSSEQVKIGNERVLKARLADAEFFINTDRSIISSQRKEQLAFVTFAEGLGSLLDRVRRMEWLVDILVKYFNSKEINLVDLTRSTTLCKHDLVSQIIFEFPELQGIMGGKYLLLEGENKDVALAVSEHYLPKGSSDSLPKSINGSLLSIVDRVELLLSIFSKGERPSGSSDPYALRRAANGTLQIIWSKGWRFDLYNFLEEGTIYWSKLFPDFNIDSNKLFDDLCCFFRQRIISLLEEKEYDFDLIQSVAGPSTPIRKLLADPLDVIDRIELLSEMRAEGKLSLVQSVVTRASRLAVNAGISTTILTPESVIDPSLFEKETEQGVLELLLLIAPIINKQPSSINYYDLVETLASGQEKLALFFDGDQSVMVMVDDKNVQANRLNLLAILTNQASILADFTVING